MKKFLLFFLPFFLMNTYLSASSSGEWRGYVPVFLPVETDGVEVVKALKAKGVTDVVFSKSPFFPPDNDPIYNHNFSNNVLEDDFSCLFFDASGENSVFYVSQKEFKSKNVPAVLEQFDASWKVPEKGGEIKVFWVFWIIVIVMWAVFCRNLLFAFAVFPFVVASLFINRFGFFHAAILFLQSVCIFSKYQKGHKPFQMVKKDKSIRLFLILSLPVAAFDSLTSLFLYILVAICSMGTIFFYFYLKNKDFSPMIPAGLFSVKSRFRMENIIFSAVSISLMLLVSFLFQSVSSSNLYPEVRIPVPVSRGFDNTDGVKISHEEVFRAYFKKKVFPFLKLNEAVPQEASFYSSQREENGKLSFVPIKTFAYNDDFKTDVMTKVISSEVPSISKLIILQDEIFGIKFKNTSKKIKNFALTTRHFLIFMISLCVLFWGIFSDHDFNKKACKKIGHSLR